MLESKMALRGDIGYWYGFELNLIEPLTNKNYVTLDFNFLSNRIDCSRFRIWRNSSWCSFYRSNHLLHLLGFACHFLDYAFGEKNLTTWFDNQKTTNH